MKVGTRGLLARLCMAGMVLGAGCRAPGEPGDGQPLRLRTVWYQAQNGHPRVQPVADGERVYTGTGNGQVIARDLATGAPRWAATVGRGSVEGGNLLVRSGVVVAPVLYHTTAVDAATGREMWRYQAPLDTVGGGPPNPGTVIKVRIAADDEAAYIAAWGPSVAAVELATGRVRWQWQPEPGTPFRFGSEGVALDGGELFMVSYHGLDAKGGRCEMWVVALEARTGRQLWLTKIPAGGAISCTAGRPAVTADRVVAMLITGEMYGLDRGTGQVVWSTPRDSAAYLAVLSSPVAHGDVIYAGAANDHVKAVRARDGEPLWRTPVRAQFTSDLLVTDRHIYGVDGPFLFVFDRRGGRLLGQVRQPNEPELGGLFPGTPTYANGRVFAPVNGGVWAFDEP
ncbi:MAG TPA: PQQ-binding-like beta-propeller repeat protein [Longimicrobium sp.]|nr:PQQ-binding-like beta-propeller repeat protein [Longimicrobium sp.]